MVKVGGKANMMLGTGMLRQLPLQAFGTIEPPQLLKSKSDLHQIVPSRITAYCAMRGPS